MAEIKSQETLLEEFKTFLKAYNKYLDTGDNSLSKDLLLTPYSVGGKGIMDQVAISRDLHIISKQTGTNLENEATNTTKERLPGSYSTVTLTFWTETTPSATITIPAGTQVNTIGTVFVSPVTFEVVNTSAFPASSAGALFSYDRGRYEFNVTAICTSIGTIGNVGSGTATSMSGSISGVTGVTNLIAASGGADSESDEDFRKRVKLANTGRDLNVPNGLQGLMQSYGFLDAYAVRVEDSDSERISGIDVFVIDQPSGAASETFVYSIGQQKYYFTHRPVVEITSVQGSLGEISTAGYSVNIDNTTQLRRSTIGQDYIEPNVLSGLSDGDSFTMYYNYSSAIEKAQQNLELTSNQVLTASPLVKRAYPMYFYLVASLTLKANADGPQTRTKCRNAIAQLMSTYRMGEGIQKSDLIVTLQTGYGDYPVDTVDAVVITSYYLRDEFGVTYQPVDETITVANKYYVVYGNATIL